MRIFQIIFILMIMSLTLAACNNVANNVGSNNQAPIIDSRSPNSAAQYVAEDLENKPFSVTAHDPEGTALSYLWETDTGSGTINNPTASSMVWTAPDASGSNFNVVIRLTITDADGIQTQDTWTIEMNPGAGDIPIYNVLQTVSDNVTPKTPEGFYANVVGNEWYLTWNAVTEFRDGDSIPATRHVGYVIWYSEDESGPFAYKTSVSSNVDNVHFTTAEDGTIEKQYWFKISTLTVDDYGNQKHSLLSGTVTHRDDAAPGIITNVYVTAYSPATNSIYYTWDAHTESDFAGYKVYRASDIGQGLPIDPSQDEHYILMTPYAIPEEGFYDTTSTQKGTYYYRVTALDFSGNESAKSRFIMVDNISPESPATLNAQTGAESGSIYLSFNVPAGDVYYYHIAAIPSGNIVGKVVVSDRATNVASYGEGAYVFLGEPASAYYIQLTFMDKYGNTSLTPITVGPVNSAP